MRFFLFLSFSSTYPPPQRLMDKLVTQRQILQPQLTGVPSIFNQVIQELLYIHGLSMTIIQPLD
jgi:hypothetical protein